MARIIKFPSQSYCGDCGKPLEADEGTECLTEGCIATGCNYCMSVSDHCAEHMTLENTPGDEGIDDPPQFVEVQ